MQTDSRKRRLRAAPPQPTDDRISLTPDDLAVFGAINRHGPLPSTFLHAFTQGKNFNAFQHRLTKLYNGAQQTAPLLSRPPQQFQSFAARYQPLVYDLTGASQRLLEEQGAAITARTDPFVHRLMSACFGASIELACQQTGLRYIPRYEILARKHVPLAIPVEGRKFIPDDLFGLQYPDGSYRFFAVEIDRNTEQIGGKASSRFCGKLGSYAKIAEGRLYRQHWGIPNLLILIITTNDAHMANMIAVAASGSDELSAQLLFRTTPEFGINWRIPSPTSTYLTSSWKRSVGPFQIDRP